MLNRRPYDFIANNFQLLGGSVVWDVHFCRNLQDNEVSELDSMLSLLEMTYISLGKMDKRV